METYTERTAVTLAMTEVMKQTSYRLQVEDLTVKKIMVLLIRP